MFDRKKLTVSVAGREIIFETGKMARQANGAVVVRSGETIVLATACAAPKAAEEADFFPLRVDYQEKFSSAGKTLGGFIKREGTPRRTGNPDVPPHRPAASPHVPRRLLQ